MTVLNASMKRLRYPLHALHLLYFLREHALQLPQVVEICESLGYQGFRARIAHDQRRHVNARETLEYVARGRHLAFICDSW